jgi:tetratricopeptide (TPR) repeat protein
MMRGLIILTLITGLAACVDTSGEGRLDPLPRELEVAAPAGTVVLQDGVDQVLVGDRLMDAGEYDLALRAYYRAAAARGLDAEITTAIGSANLRLGRVSQAETQFRRAIAIDESFVPAWNNLGVALMEQGQYGEARRTFEQAFALDSGRSDSIRENLRLAIARMENNVYTDPNNQGAPGLIRRGGGVFVLLSDP